MILRLDQPMFFANAEPSLRRVADMVADKQKQVPLAHVIISMEETPNLDGTSIEALIVLAKNLHDKGINLSLCRLHRRARLGLMNAASPYLMPSQLSYLSVDRAVKDALAKDRPDQVRDTYTPGARHGLQGS